MDEVKWSAQERKMLVRLRLEDMKEKDHLNDILLKCVLIKLN